MKEVQLGMDIGTQFCWVGYFDKDAEKFISLVPRGEGWENGIPTQVAYNRYSGSFKYCKDAEDAAVTMPEVWELTRKSIKTAMRKHPNGIFEDVPGGKCNHEIFKDFIAEVKKLTLDEYNRQKNSTDKIKVKSIWLGYPNVDSNSRIYMNDFAKIVSEVFGIHEQKVHCLEEAAIAAFLAKNVNNLSIDRKIMTVDVGAGTTDIALVSYDEYERMNKIDEQVSIDVGGKNIDDAILSKFRNIRSPTSLQLIQYKKWLYNNGRDGISIEGHPLEEAKRILDFDAFNSELKNTITNGLVAIFNSLRNSRLITKFEKQSEDDGIVVFLMGGSSVLPFITDAISDFIRGEREYFFEDSPRSFTSLLAAQNLGVTNSNFISLATAAYDFGELHPDAEPAFNRALNGIARPIPNPPVRPITISGAPTYYVLNDIENKYHLIAYKAPKKGENYFLTNTYWYLATDVRYISLNDYNQNISKYSDYEMAKDADDPENKCRIYKRPKKFKIDNWFYSLELKDEVANIPEKDCYTESELKSYCKKIELIDNNFSSFKGETNDNAGHYLGVVYNYQTGRNNALSIYIFPKDEKNVTYTIGSKTYTGKCYCDPEAGQDKSMTYAMFKELAEKTKRDEEKRRKDEIARKEEKDRRKKELTDASKIQETLKAIESYIKNLETGINSHKRHLGFRISTRRENEENGGKAKIKAGNLKAQLEKVEKSLKDGDSSLYYKNVAYSMLDNCIAEISSDYNETIKDLDKYYKLPAILHKNIKN